MTLCPACERPAPPGRAAHPGCEIDAALDTYRDRLLADAYDRLLAAEPTDGEAIDLGEAS